MSAHSVLLILRTFIKLFTYIHQASGGNKMRLLKRLKNTGVQMQEVKQITLKQHHLTKT